MLRDNSGGTQENFKSIYSAPRWARFISTRDHSLTSAAGEYTICPCHTDIQRLSSFTKSVSTFLAVQVIERDR